MLDNASYVILPANLRFAAVTREPQSESFTVIGPDLRPVDVIDEYLAWLTNNECSPNTVEAYAHDPASVLNVS